MHGKRIPEESRRAVDNLLVDRAAQSPILWEAGHFYLAKGPTEWTTIGWQILERLANHDRDGRLLFIDDVHPLEAMSTEEHELGAVHFTPSPSPSHIVLESMMHDLGLEVLAELTRLPRRRRARITGRDRVWHCSGFPLTDRAGKPLCLLYDLALTRHKYQLGYDHAVNIIPVYYERQQWCLKRLTRKVVPELTLDVLLFDREGTVWRLD